MKSLVTIKKNEITYQYGFCLIIGANEAGNILRIPTNFPNPIHNIFLLLKRIQSVKYVSDKFIVIISF